MRAFRHALVTAAVCLASPALADLEICNRTSFVVETAVGIEDQGVAATRGWFRIDPGECRAVMRGETPAGTLYVHARALPVYGLVQSILPDERQLCVGDGEFLIAGAQRCQDAKHRMVAFGAMEPRETEQGRAVMLAESADYDAEQAHHAAVQRLLTLAGYDAEPIDGIAGRRTEAALGRFLRERRLPAETADAPDLLNVLIAAVRQGAGPGLLWCNETRHRVMAALAVEEGRRVTARGWWRLEPGSCLRPELSQREGVRLYSFAEAVDADGAVIQVNSKPLAWGGSKRLCVRNSRFEITEHDDCASRGLDAQGFVAIEMAHGGATVRFEEPK